MLQGNDCYVYNIFRSYKNKDEDNKNSSFMPNQTGHGWMLIFYIYMTNKTGFHLLFVCVGGVGGGSLKGGGADREG